MPGLNISQFSWSCGDIVRCAVRSDRGRPMINISLPYVFMASSLLEKLQSLPSADTKIEDVSSVLISAHQQMMNLHAPESFYAPGLRSAIQSGEFLAAVLKKQTDDLATGRVIPAQDLSEIKRKYEQYRPALLGALSAMGSFLVTQKGSHDAFALLFEGERLFPSDLREKVPEAFFDAQQAGKCLAYDVATACGFHVFRVTESVVRRYWSLVTGGEAHPKVRSLGVYIAALTRSGAGDPKVLAALRQMNELHRNPLIHPEAALTTDEALNIAGLARSAVAAMLVHMSKLPPTTTTAVP
jgi:hypothetical protein